MYALVDCNNFYASCEKVFNPAVKHRPVVVLSNNDGCVIARSKEAKALGIPMGIPAFQIKEMIRKHGIVIFSTNFTLYGDMSRRVMNTLSTFTPDLEVYSIDEAFLSLEGFEHLDLKEYAWEIYRTVERNIGIQVGVGIAPTKTLSKAANEYAKKKAGGVFAVSTPEEIAALLRWLPVDDVWGIGRRHGKRLHGYGIHTAHDFVTKMSEEWVQSAMSIVGVRTWKELQGIPCIELEDAPPPKQSIATTRTFGKMVTELKGLEEAVTSFSTACAAKMRKAGLVARQVQVFIHTNPHRSDMARYARNQVLTLPVASNDTMELNRYALRALHDIFKEGYYYKKAGVVVMGLVPDSEVQLNFLDTVDRDRQKQLMGALDSLTHRYGKRALQPAAVGLGRKQWHMNQQRLSPCYTTRWDDIIQVKV